MQKLKQNKRLLGVCIVMLGLAIGYIAHVNTQYNRAVELSQQEGVTYQEIENAFSVLGQYRDSYERMQLAHEARIKAEAKAEIEAEAARVVAEEQRLVAERTANHLAAINLLEQGLYEQAMGAFENLLPYFDSENRFLESKYRFANELVKKGDYRQAARLYAILDDYRDSEERLFDIWAGIILEHIWQEVQENGGHDD